MYTLYYAPGACSRAVHAVLCELGVKFEIKQVNLRERSPDFLKINPRGQVPTLVENGNAITEGAAIIIYLIEKHGSDLLPKPGTPESAKALQWLMFFNASVHPAYVPAFGPQRFVDGEAAQQNLVKKTVERVQGLWDYVDQQLEGKKYLAGDACTAADILMTVIAGWTLNGAIMPGPNVQRVTEAVQARPAFQKAVQAETGEKKAA
jgi:glutathione S-transferase